MHFSNGGFFFLKEIVVWISYTNGWWWLDEFFSM